MNQRPLLLLAALVPASLAAALLLNTARHGAAPVGEGPPAIGSEPRPDRTSVEPAPAAAEGWSTATDPGRRSEATDPDPSHPSAPTHGTLSVRVVAPPRTSVAGVQMSVHGPRAHGPRTLGDDGVAVYDGLEPGTYTVWIDDQTLPEGVLSDPCDGTRTQDREVEVRAGETAELELALPQTARVYGTILRANGAPLEGASVQLRGIVSASPVAFGGGCDGDGRYSVAACPGVYRLFVFWEHEPGRVEDVHPPRGRIELAPGDVQQHDAVIGPQGPCSVSGIVVDQDGEPCSDLEVRCYYWRAWSDLGPGESPYSLLDRANEARTDEAGRFALHGLAPETYRIGITAEAVAVRRPPLTSQVRKHPAAIDVVLTEEEPARDLGRIAVETSRPYSVTVRLRVAETWIARTRGGLDALRVEVREHGGPPGARQPGRLERDGDVVTWWCETPHPPVELIVSERAGRRASLALDPDTMRTEERELAFP